jgi:hypothetical protein
MRRFTIGLIIILAMMVGILLTGGLIILAIIFIILADIAGARRCPNEVRRPDSGSHAGREAVTRAERRARARPTQASCGDGSDCGAAAGNDVFKEVQAIGDKACLPVVWRGASGARACKLSGSEGLPARYKTAMR